MNQSRQLLSPAYRRSFTSCIQDIGSCLHWLLFFFAFGYFSDPPYDGASGNTHDLLFSLLFHPIFGSQLFLILSRLIPLVEQSLASKGGPRLKAMARRIYEHPFVPIPPLSNRTRVADRGAQLTSAPPCAESGGRFAETKLPPG